jgi:hypothetical protein
VADGADELTRRKLAAKQYFNTNVRSVRPLPSLTKRTSPTKKTSVAMTDKSNKLIVLGDYEKYTKPSNGSKSVNLHKCNVV